MCFCNLLYAFVILWEGVLQIPAALFRGVRSLAGLLSLDCGAAMAPQEEIFQNMDEHERAENLENLENFKHLLSLPFEKLSLRFSQKNKKDDVPKLVSHAGT